MKEQRPKYLFYATLLDSFQGYIGSSEIYQKYWGFSEDPPKSEFEFEQEQFQSLIDRINRVPIDSEPADRGTCFNEIIDCPIEGRKSDKVELISNRETDSILAKYNNREFVFSLSTCRKIAKSYEGAIPQVLTKALLETKYGLVELYGYIDELMPTSIVDIKVKGKYKAFSFKNNWQHRVYPYCLQSEGTDLSEFVYDIYVLDENNQLREGHKEVYAYSAERDIPALTAHCEGLIELIEANRHLITDKKIFNEHQ